MKKLIFETSDFEQTYGHYQKELHEAYCRIAQAKHDAFMKELIDGATKVYCAKPDKENSHLWSHHKTQDYDTHTALLIDVKEIEKKPCEHEPNLLNQKIGGWFCKHCGVELVASWVAK